LNLDQTDDLSRTAALTRSKSGVISEFITKYTPASVLRLALRLPVDPMRAIFNFQTVTKQIMEERAQELETGEKEGDDLLSIICACVLGTKFVS
jgi:hypothetical protein